MTLSRFRKDFCELLAAVRNVDVSTIVSQWPPNAIDDKFNTGITKVSDVMKAFDHILVDGITSGVNRYGLPSNVISVKKVDIYRNGKLYARPRPADMADIDNDDPLTQQPLVPFRYSVSQMLYGDGSSQLELFLSPAPGWTEANALYTYVLARFPEVLSADGSAEVVIPPQLGQAALYWALYLASGMDGKFAALYEDSLTTYYRSGVVSNVYTKSDPWPSRAWPVRNPNDSSA